MRHSALAAVFFIVPSVLSVPGFAQQAGTDTTSQYHNEGRGQQDVQRPDDRSNQSSPTEVDRTPQSQAQSTPVQPERTPQQSDQVRDRERRSAEDTRINRDWTTRQRSEDRMDRDRMRQRQMERLMDQDDDHQTVGRNGRRDDDDMDRGHRYGYAERNEGRYHYDLRQRPRVKTCLEYENGDEFCRYRD
jgi:Mg-chelatase subunit ChlI